MIYCYRIFSEEKEREQNGRQVFQKMKARVELGFWPLKPPIGFKHVKGEGGGKVLAWDEPMASVVRGT